MTRRLAALAVLLAALAAGPPARAEDDVAEAKVRFRNGAELYRAKKWREAIAEFEAAYRLKPHGAIHYNVAQCRERLGEWPAAVRAYHDYLREVPDASDRAAVRASIAKLEAKLATAGVQVLLVYSDPPGAEVRVDGHPRGRTPVHVVLPPGTYAVALSLDGHEPARQDVTLREDASRVVDVELRRAIPPPGVSGAPPGSGAPATASAAPPGAGAEATPERAPPPGGKPDLSAPRPAASALPPPVPEPDRPRAHRRVWTWVSAGAAAAALAAGAYYGVTAQRRSAELRDGTVRTAADSTQLRDSAVSSQRRANVLYGVAAAAGAAGATLFYVEGRF